MPSSETPRWKLVENAVAAIEGSLSSVEGAAVIPNASVPERASGKRRQVDVLVEIPSGPRVLRVGIEVRDTSVPLDVTDVEQLGAKLKKLDLDVGCIVSQAGFSADALREAGDLGLEARTLASISQPDWWLPSEIEVHQRRLQLLHMQLNYRPEDIPEVIARLAGVEVEGLVVKLSSDESVALRDFVSAQVLRGAQDPPELDVKDGDTFTARLDFGQLDGMLLQLPDGGTLAIPQTIDVLVRVHVVVESVPLAGYEGSSGVTAFTGLSESLEKQMTFVAIEQPDGTRRISVTMAQPKPARTRIERRPPP